MHKSQCIATVFAVCLILSGKLFFFSAIYCWVHFYFSSVEMVSPWVVLTYLLAYLFLPL